MENTNRTGKGNGFGKLIFCVSVFCLLFFFFSGRSGEKEEKSEYYVEKVTFPEGTPVVNYVWGEDEVYEKELSELLKQRPHQIALRNKAIFSMSDFYTLDYGSFWVRRVSDQRMDTIENGEDVSYELLTFYYYDLSDEEIEAMKKEIDRSADQILEWVSPSMDDYQKVKFIHDVLCKKITYDRTFLKPHIHDLYGAMVNGEAVCSGYASAFEFLMRRLGYTVYTQSLPYLYICMQGCAQS